MLENDEASVTFIVVPSTKLEDSAGVASGVPSAGKAKAAAGISAKRPSIIVSANKADMSLNFLVAFFILISS